MIVDVILFIMSFTLGYFVRDFVLLNKSIKLDSKDSKTTTKQQPKVSVMFPKSTSQAEREKAIRLEEKLLKDIQNEKSINK